MAKVLPLLPAASSQSSSSAEHPCHGLLLGQQRQAVYTVWMKSLVFNGNGCTVYGADGGVAFRVDNYGCRGGREVFFMDRAGNALIRIQRKGLGVFKRWEASLCFDDGDGEVSAGVETTTRRPWFKVKKTTWMNAATVTLHDGSGRTYTVDGCARKSDYKIYGAVAAAVSRKQTASGVVLGEDVLSLTVGSDVDHLLVLGVVVVCGLINRCL